MTTQSTLRLVLSLDPRINTVNSAVSPFLPTSLILRHVQMFMLLVVT